MYCKGLSTKLEKNSPVVIMKLKPSELNKVLWKFWQELQQEEEMLQMMMIILSTILKACLWVGMENPFLIGFTNFMVLVKSLSVKSAAGRVIGVEEPLKNTFRSGVMLMA